MKYYYLLMVGLLLVIVAGCSPKQVLESEIEYAIDDSVRDVAMDAKNAAIDKADEASQEFVNFKCDELGRTFYFLKGKAKIENKAVGTETWIDDQFSYLQSEVGDETYLVQYPVEDSGLSLRAMKVTYETSKQIDTLTCELDVVTEEDVAFPDLEILTDEEFQQKFLDSLVQFAS